MLTEWRLGRGWNPEEIADRLARLAPLPRSFDMEYRQMTPENGWNRYFSEAVIAKETPGEAEPGGPFHCAQVAVSNFQFSDPSIVIGHFDADKSLLGRRMLLEIRALHAFYYLAGVVVNEVRSESDADQHIFGFRYDTLLGHLERGTEWFTLSKDKATGEVSFRIEAAWRPGNFPNWWSRCGFHLVAPRYQLLWHHHAHLRLFQVAAGGIGAAPPVDERGIAHAGPDVTFRRTPRRRTIRKPRLEEEKTLPGS